MKKLDLYISSVAPNVRDGAWLKPVEGGYILQILDGGWKEVNLVNTKKEAPIVTNDKKLLGTPKDTSKSMTLYGLKAYIDEQLAGLE
jgi:hypothetical protein